MFGAEASRVPADQQLHIWSTEMSLVSALQLSHYAISHYILSVYLIVWQWKVTSVKDFQHRVGVLHLMHTTKRVTHCVAAQTFKWYNLVKIRDHYQLKISTTMLRKFSFEL